jgi:hypothetical protein
VIFCDGLSPLRAVAGITVPLKYRVLADPERFLDFRLNLQVRALESGISTEQFRPEGTRRCGRGDGQKDNAGALAGGAGPA